MFEMFNLSSLRTGIMAGSTPPIEAMKRVVNDMNMTEITSVYGLTEGSQDSPRPVLMTPGKKSGNRG
jgi:fatty-acyl-CoA synthase